ncbi:energy-coupled thiamine transporter ThiT [Candidatus Xianfuyuplasma coldseepsis]|uniref:Thiamine transporter n=1 Tax=Candidatus Xianfuyuplasma coldseepsis TaxID=2782163 RepID=A0A7L7KVP5_9MOLU|nr:energy-coupled thiamine transporter ThiT [Xianfuyuplasma coldseepsis]QMS85818.1 hypothetical protein G4Z02_08690 [Xianfuyuplasma coldseepsis]
MNTSKLTEIAILVSLAVVLEVIFTGIAAFFPILEMPYGGRVSLSMLPLFIIVYRHGLKDGIIAGVTYSLLNLLLDAKLWHWASLFLDYIFAFGVIGLGALVFQFMDKNKSSFVVMVVIGVLLRFVFHYISGVVIFDFILGFTPEEFANPWWYSFLYNIYYIGPSMILVIITGLLMFERLEKANILEA